jgi:hypothetical protein
MNSLLLITGAGASFDVVNRSLIPTNTEFRPPLTRDLFYPSPRYIRDFKLEERLESNYVNLCLENHPIAAKIGLDYKIRVVKGKETKGLEDFLHNLKNDKKILKRNQFWSVPPYLYDLFANISRKYIPTKRQHPIATNYKLLIEAINDSIYSQLIWLNLNYDVLADVALKSSVTKSLDNLANYLKLETQDGLKIMYTKPHGSIDWFKKIDYSGLSRKITCDYISRNPIGMPIDFENRLSKELFTEAERDNLMRVEPDSRWYPAITAPLGKYEFVCAQHKVEIANKLKNTSSILCIGFSALDRDILDLIRDNIVQIDKLKIVNGNSSAAGNEAYDLIKEYCKEKLNVAKGDSVFNGGFSDFIATGMEGWLGSL